MIVDDIVANLTVARNLLRSYYEIYLAPSANQMFKMLEKIHPDLILLDIEMPEIDGYEAITRLKKSEDYAHIPIIFLTSHSDEASELKGFDLGAVDYVSKPFSSPLLLKRIEHQISLVRQRELIQSYTNNLSALVDEKISEVISLQNAILATVADLVECRDRFTGGHIARSQLYLKVLMDSLHENKIYWNIISGWDLEYVLRSSQLHDVGKIAIPDAILNKAGQLSLEEFEIMKTHVAIGVDAVSKMSSKTKEQQFLRYAINIVGTHHEKWDGTGYPDGLKGESIPLEGRLMAIADVYDALVSWRPYKKNMSHEQAREIIRENSGTHFDPVLVNVFLNVESVFANIAAKDAPEANQCPVSHSK